MTSKGSGMELRGGGKTKNFCRNPIIVGPLISIEGTIGVGKSTAASQAEKLIRGRVTVIGEKLFLPFLSLFYGDPKKYGFSFQLAKLHQCQKRYIMGKIASENGDIVLFDRSIPGNRAFKEVQVVRGNMDPLEAQIYENISRMIPEKYDGIILLDVEPEIALKRINTRSRFSENGIELDYLVDLRDALDQVLGRNTYGKVVKLDWNSVEPNQSGFSLIKEGLEYLIGRPILGDESVGSPLTKLRFDRLIKYQSGRPLSIPCHPLSVNPVLQKKYKNLCGRFLVLEGTLGVGKTTSVWKIKRLLGSLGIQVVVFQERPDPSFLKLYYENTSKYCFAFQYHMLAVSGLNIDQGKAIICHPTKKLDSTSKYDTPKPLIIIDRGPVGQSIFASLRKDQGYIDEPEFGVYKTLFADVLQRLRECDPITITLRARTELLMQRIKKRGIKSEQDLPHSYIEELTQRHDKILPLVFPKTITLDWSSNSNPSIILDAAIRSI